MKPVIRGPILSGHQLEYQMFSPINCKINLYSADPSIKRTQSAILGYFVAQNPQKADISRAFYFSKLGSDSFNIVQRCRFKAKKIIPD